MLLTNSVDEMAFQGIIGALDDTHIKIRAPKDHPMSYVNRKKQHTIHLQAICDSEMLFTYCHIGYPGSCHDARVFRNSDFWDGGLQRCNPNYIIADGAYPLQRWLLTPFRDNGLLNQEQRNYNHMLSANRVVIERSFGLLKGRFRRLQYLETLTVETAVYIATGCTVVHNVCLLNNDRIEDFLQNDQQIDNMQVMHLNENDAEGAIKRNIIARNLARQ